MFSNFAIMSDAAPQISTDSNHHVTTIRELLGLPPGGFVTLAQAETAPPKEIPIAAVPKTQREPFPPPPPPPPFHEPVAPLPPAAVAQKAKLPVAAARGAVRFWQSDYVRLPAIFLVSLGVFYVVLNFRAIGSQVGGWFAPPPKNEAAVLGAQKPEYDQWIKKFYVVANDPAVLAANEDADRDGLTNLQEFYLDTNPLLADTDGDGYNDGTEVVRGYNPLYTGPLTPGQKKIVDEHLKDGQIENRIQYHGRPDIAGFIPAASAAGGEEGAVAETIAPRFVLEPAKAGNLSIPKLGTNVAVVWTQDFAKMNDDLKYGVAHHPASVYPGEIGMSSIHGHSSGYPWDGNYKNAFTRLNYLVAGDEVFVTVFAADGEERKYRYIVKSAKVYAKDDEAQFQALAAGSFLNLSTSWPIGTARERYVVTAELAGL